MPAAPVRHALRLLGSPAIVDADGHPLGGRVAHRHRLALLAVLALARPGGVRRDRLVGLLWPERDARGARSLLRVALHELRLALGPGTLAAVGDEVRLESAPLPADVDAFEAACAARDHGRAVALYTGPFLDGLFLDDAQAFDDWVRRERARLAARHEEALEALAAAAERAGDPAGAAGHWRVLAAHRPGDGRVALRLVDALAGAGDVAGALGHADAHAAHLREEFGVAPDVSIRAAVARLRARSADELPGDVPPSPPRIAAAVRDPVPGAPAPASADVAPADVAPADVAVRAGRWRRGAVAALALVSVAVAGVALAATLARRGDERDPDRAPAALAVAPFAVVAGVPGELGAGLADLLTANLDQAGGFRLVPARVAAGRAARLGGGDAGSAPAAELRTSLDVDAVVTGSVAPAPGGAVVARAALVGRDGAVRARVEARAAAANLPALVDTLSAGLLRELWGRRSEVPAPRLAAIGTTSPAALRAYLRGEGHFRAARWDSAALAFADALDADSTFALAHMRLAETNGWRNGMGHPTTLRALAAATRWADRLPPRERRLLVVSALHEAGDVAAVDSAAQFAARYPDDPDALYLRADTRFHARHLAGELARRHTAALFDAAAAADPTSSRVRAHPITLALEMGDLARFDRHVAALARLSREAGDAGTDWALVRAVRWGTPAEAFRTFVARLRTAPPSEPALWELLPALERACLGAAQPRPDLALAALDSALAAYARLPDQRAFVLQRRAVLLAALGRLDAAAPALDAALWAVHRDDTPAIALFPAIVGYAPAAWSARVTERLALDPAWTDTPLRRREAEYWRAVAALAAGDVGRARGALARAVRRRGGAPGDSVPRWLDGLARAAEGWTVLLEGDTTRAVAELGAGIRAAGYVSSAEILSRPLRVRLTLLEAARPASRRAAIDRLRYLVGSWDGLPWAWWRLELARALEGEGDAAGAAAERARFDALWRGADPGARR